MGALAAARAASACSLAAWKLDVLEACSEVYVSNERAYLSVHLIDCHRTALRLVGPRLPAVIVRLDHILKAQYENENIAPDHQLTYHQHESHSRRDIWALTHFGHSRDENVQGSSGRSTSPLDLATNGGYQLTQ